MKNNKIILTSILCIIFMSSCAAPDFYTVEDVEKEKVKLEKGKTQSAEYSTI